MINESSAPSHRETWTNTIDVRPGSKECQIDLKLDKTGTFSDQWAKMYWKLIFKSTRFIRILGQSDPIWGQLWHHRAKMYRKLMWIVSRCPILCQLCHPWCPLGLSWSRWLFLSVTRGVCSGVSMSNLTVTENSLRTLSDFPSISFLSLHRSPTVIIILVFLLEDFLFISCLCECLFYYFIFKKRTNRISIFCNVCQRLWLVTGKKIPLC